MLTKTLAFTASLLLLAPEGFASGSSINRLPTPGATAVAGGLDREKFTLGQKVFTGGVRPSGHESAAAQGERLRALQARLPGDIAEKINLPQLAGRLQPAQLEALEYFVTQRYPAK
jgi:hypothetical protein